MTKSDKLRKALRDGPGAALDELEKTTKLDRAFIATVCGQWVRAGKARGTSADGFTLLEELPPRIKGNKAELRDSKRAKLRVAKGPANGARVVLTPAGARLATLLRQVGGDHYRRLGIQPWEALRAWLTPEEWAGYMKGTVIAYLARERGKGGLGDVQKAAHTLEHYLATAARTS